MARIVPGSLPLSSMAAKGARQKTSHRIGGKVFIHTCCWHPYLAPLLTQTGQSQTPRGCLTAAAIDQSGDLAAHELAVLFV